MEVSRGTFVLAIRSNFSQLPSLLSQEQKLLKLSLVRTCYHKLESVTSPVRSYNQEMERHKWAIIG
jgi:hypothetical protein